MTVVKKYSHIMPVNVLGTDDQGRVLVQCPSRGCGLAAYVADDGRVVCPAGEAEAEYLRQAMAIMATMEAGPCFDT